MNKSPPRLSSGYGVAYVEANVISYACVASENLALKRSK